MEMRTVFLGSLFCCCACPWPSLSAGPLLVLSGAIYNGDWCSLGRIFFIITSSLSKWLLTLTFSDSSFVLKKSECQCLWLPTMYREVASQPPGVVVWMRMAPQAQRFECLVPGWWGWLGMIKKWDLVGGGVSLSRDKLDSFKAPPHPSCSLGVLVVSTCKFSATAQQPAFRLSRFLPQSQTLTFWNHEIPNYILYL